MYRSVFTKYITAFMLIIIVSFTILAAIISSMVFGYSMDSEKDILARNAEKVRMYMETEQRSTDWEDYGFNMYVVYHRDQIKSTLAEFIKFSAAHSEPIIFLTDTSGNILLLSDNAQDAFLGNTLSSSVQIQLNAGRRLERYDDLDGMLNSKYLVCAEPILTASGEVCGAVFLASADSSMNQLVEVMIKTIIMATLWVLLAALIAVYFISEKIIGPLKDMSKAAKCFAAGQFDVRIPVIGRDEVADLATAFNNMASSLAIIEDMRRTFLANVSHDLRTPMTTIAGFIDGILEGAIPPEKHEYYLNVIATEIRRLSRLVSTLLDIARIQAGDRKFNMAPFDICEMARQILISFEQKIDAKKLDVEFECDEDKMFVIADRDAIYQILYNICDNAVKFSREEGSYKISLHTKEKKVYVSVYNEGQGIAEEDIPYVFDRFYKSDKSRGLDKTGTGLGLFIAKTIVDAHSENIWVKSEFGKYCEFAFTLQRTTEQYALKYKDEKEKEKEKLAQQTASKQEK